VVPLRLCCSTTWPAGRCTRPARSSAPGHAYYNLNSGGGDFSTCITGDRQYAYVAFPYAPGRQVLDTYLAKVPLTMIQGPPAS